MVQKSLANWLLSQPYVFKNNAWITGYRFIQDLLSASQNTEIKMYKMIS